MAMHITFGLLIVKTHLYNLFSSSKMLYSVLDIADLLLMPTSYGCSSCAHLLVEPFRSDLDCVIVDIDMTPLCQM